MVPGQVCAVLYCDLWHRAEIVSGIQKDNTAKVSIYYSTVVGGKNI